MRQLGGAAARTSLGPHASGGVMTATKPFAALGGFSLGNGHWRILGVRWEVGGGRALLTPARSLVEIRAAARTQPATIVSAQRKQVHREGQFLPQSGSHIQVRQGIGQGIDARILLQLRIGREEHLHRPIHRSHEFREAPPADHPNASLELSVPVVAPVPRRLEISLYLDGSEQRHLEPLEQRIIRRHLPGNRDRTAPKLPEINLKHGV